MNHSPIQSLPALQLRCWQPHQDGLRLRVLSGRLWLTQSGDARDHFLAPGDELVLTDQRVVIEAQSDTRYALEAAQTSSTRQRLISPDWLQGLLHHASESGHPAQRHPDPT